MMDAVLGPNPSPSDFIHPPPEVEQKVTEFINGLKTRFQEEQYPPAAYIRVGGMYILSEYQFWNSSLRAQDMHEDSEQSVASCNQLLQATMGALPPTAQRLLLGVTVMKRNRRAHTIFVLRRWV